MILVDMIQTYSFSKNTFYLLFAYISQKLLALFYFIFLARYLGPAEIGIYSFAISFVMIVAVFLDFGFATALIREIARDREKTSQYLSNALTLKIVLSFFIYPLIIVLANLLNYPTLTKQVVYLVGLYVIFESLGTTCYSILRGWQNMRYESLGIFFNKIIAVGLGLLLIFLKFTLPFLILPLLLAAVFYFLYPLFIIRKKFKINFFFTLNKNVLASFFKISLPLTLGTIFATLFSSINTFLLSFFGQNDFVGFFAIALKIPNALLFIPAALSAAIFPVFSYHYLHTKEVLIKKFEKVTVYLMILVMPILFGGLGLAKQIIFFIYGANFKEAIIVFQVLICAVIFMFFDFLFSSFLTATNKQTLNALARGTALVVNLFLSLLLMPNYLHLGAGLAFTFSLLIFFILQLFLILKTVKLNLKSLVKRFFLIFLASVLMSLVLLLVKEKVHLIFSLITGFISYFFILYLIRGLTKDDLVEVKNLIRLFLKIKKGVVQESSEL